MPSDPTRGGFRRKLVFWLTLPILGPLWLFQVGDVLTEEWFTGRGPAWWHWLRGEERQR